MYARNTSICFYCYTVTNELKNFNIQNKFDKTFITSVNDFSENVENKNSYKNKLIFGKLLCVNDGIDYTPDYHVINDYKSIDLSQYLQYGKFDMLVVPDGNSLDIDNFLSQINIYLSDNPSIIIGFYRENHYCNDLYNYNYIYNCYSIDRIAKKYNLYVQKDFTYKDDFYIISIGRNEPSNFEIDELEKLTNNHLIEDYNHIFLNNINI